MERMDITTQTTFGGYALWDDTQGAYWPEYHADIYFQYNQAQTSFHRSLNGVAVEGNHTIFNPPLRNVTGENLNIGARPGGDLVPPPSVDPTACGTGYVSPGYQ